MLIAQKKRPKTLFQTNDYIIQNALTDPNITNIEKTPNKIK